MPCTVRVMYVAYQSCIHDLFIHIDSNLIRNDTVASGYLIKSLQWKRHLYMLIFLFTYHIAFNE